MIKIETLLTEKLNDKIDAIIRLAKEKTGGEKGYVPFDGRTKSFRTWTRGDGARSKDWDQLVPRNLEKFGWKTEAEAINWLWNNVIEELPGKKISVKGEFGSSPWYPAKAWKGVVFKKGDNVIYYGTTSRLRNSSVWTSKERE